MKQPCSEDTKAINPQGGMALVLFALLAPVLIGLVALAADLGSLYLARDRLNSLARTGAAAGMNLRALKGWANLACNSNLKDGQYGLAYSGCVETLQPSTQTSQVLDAMKEAIVASIQKYYPNENTTDISNYLRFRSGSSTTWKDTIEKGALDLYSPDESVRLQVKYSPKTILVSKLGSIFGSNYCTHPNLQANDRCEVVSEASDSAGYLRPANIYLLLDTSGSMAKETSPGSGTKINALKQAVTNFIDNFNPRRDKLTLVPFSTGAQQNVSPPSTFNTPAGGGNDRFDIKQKVVDLTPNGQTNPCDALIQTIRALPTPDPLQPNAASPASFAVLFTDGAPNVYRLGFCNNGQNGCASAPPAITAAITNVPNIQNDWYGWTVKWGQRITVTNPTTNPNTDPNADPVFGLPQIVTAGGSAFSGTGTTWNSNGIQTLGNLVIDQTGRFRLLASDNKWYTLNNVPTTVNPAGPFKLAFQSLSLAQDNYLWNGPSYLVNAAYPIINQNALIDRIIPITGVAPPITCGPPTGDGADLFSYNHSRYFASRVLDSAWNFQNSRTDTGLSRLTGFPTVNTVANTPLIPHLLSFPGLTDTQARSTPALPTGKTQYPILPLPTTNPGCLNTLNSFLPFTNGSAQIHVRQQTNATNPVISNANTNTIQTVGEIVKSAELPYYCAVRAADYLREKGVVLFVIGLGPAASDTYGTGCNDPLQNALDFDRRKDNFLRRLAFAPESLTDPATFIGGGSSDWATGHDFRFNSNLQISCNSHPLNGINVRMGYSDAAITSEGNSSQEGSSPGGAPGVTSPDQFGAYYPSNDPSELTPLFGKIAKQILLRLSM